MEPRGHSPAHHQPHVHVPQVLRLALLLGRGQGAYGHRRSGGAWAPPAPLAASLNDAHAGGLSPCGQRGQMHAQGCKCILEPHAHPARRERRVTLRMCLRMRPVALAWTPARVRRLQPPCPATFSIARALPCAVCAAASLVVSPRHAPRHTQAARRRRSSSSTTSPCSLRAPMCATAATYGSRCSAPVCTTVRLPPPASCLRALARAVTCRAGLCLAHL